MGIALRVLLLTDLLRLDTSFTVATVLILWLLYQPLGSFGVGSCMLALVVSSLYRHIDVARRSL